MAVATLTALAIGMTAAGTATSAVGQYKSGKAAKKAAEFNEAVAQAQSLDALERGRINENTYRQQIKSAIGATRAGFAGQNIVVGTGSAADVQADTAHQGEIDALQIRTDAQREAWGYSVQATNERMAGENAAREAKFGIASTLLGGGAQIAGAFRPRPSMPTRPYLPGRQTITTAGLPSAGAARNI